MKVVTDEAGTSRMYSSSLVWATQYKSGWTVYARWDQFSQPVVEGESLTQQEAIDLMGMID